MGQKGHAPTHAHDRYSTRYQEPAQRLTFDMPQALIVIFLLFFAVLAFAWFYLQRAKARDTSAEATDSTATPAMAASTPSGEASYAQSTTDASHEHPEHDEHEGHDHSDPDHQH
jgi:hypothetical protein